MTTLVLSPKQARVLLAVLNVSNVKGSPMDEDCLSCEDMAHESLVGKCIKMDREEVTEIVWKIWETLDKKYGS